MKKILLIAIGCIVTYFTLVRFAGFTKHDPSSNNIVVTPASPTVIDTFTKSTALSLDNTVFFANYVRVSDMAKLTLIPNFDARIGSEEYLDQHACSLITNSVFYSTTYEPIGLFVSDGQTLGNFKTNALFDTVVTLSYANRLTFSSQFQDDNTKHAIQTGPRLINNGNYAKLTIKNDNFARRIVLASDSTSLYFIVFFDKQSLFSGPYLADLPNYLQAFTQAENIDLTDAVNLDGGSASVFINEDITLRELSPVGAFFCVSKD